MKHVVVGTAGHIDHGKSSLVFALTGTDPDRLQEEKARGITIDLGFAHTIEGDVVLSFVDVPGHERFVRNMLAGVGGVDLVMLHVAADESVMPQTREHFEICRLLHVPAGLIVITKSDLVDADTLDVVRLEVQELVAGSFLDNAPVLAVSARSGQGIAELRRLLAARGAETARRPARGPARLPIDRVFTMRGFGTIVTGTLVSGRIQNEAELRLVPSGRAVKVRGLQVHGRTCDEALAGQRVAINLAGVEVGEIGRGETLTVENAVTVTRRADVELELLPAARPLRHGSRVRVHQGTRELQARVALAVGTAVDGGTCAYARLHFEAPAALVRGDRFILRGSSPVATVGGGVVLDPLPPRRGVRTAAGRTRFERLRQGPVDAVIVFTEEGGLHGFPTVSLPARAGVDCNLEPQVIEDAIARGAVQVGATLIAAARLAGIRQQALTSVRQYHAQHPLEEGVPREELRERLCAGAAPGVFEHVLADLVSAGEAIARERVALRGHSLALTDEEARVRDGILTALEAGGLAPPDLAELATRARAGRSLVDRVAGLLVRQKQLVRIGDLLFHTSALSHLKDDVRSLKRDDGTTRIDVGTFKDRYHVTRKYAIPLLEFLDRERVTRRVGESRQIL
jgi:selenocysteine-specific elongation factor